MSHALAAWAGAGVGVLAGAHFAPALAGLRRARLALWPALAGVGRSGHVALTFDDGPDAASTPTILDALDRLGWRASFFMLGRQVQRSPGLAADIGARGHEVAAHGFEHANHLARSWRWVDDDLARAIDVIGDATGSPPRLWRPPYGALSASSLVAARRRHVTTLLWTTWGRDWESSATPASVASVVAATWQPGPTVLLHDSDTTSAPGSWRATAGALDLLARRWEAEGIVVGTAGDHGIMRTRGHLPRAAH